MALSELEQSPKKVREEIPFNGDSHLRLSFGFFVRRHVDGEALLLDHQQGKVQRKAVRVV